MDDKFWEFGPCTSSISQVVSVTEASGLGHLSQFEDVDFFNTDKCEYCRRTVFTWDRECPGCGAPNKIYMKASS